MTLTVELGRTTQLVRDIRDWARAHHRARQASGEPVDLLVNGKLIAN